MNFEKYFKDGRDAFDRMSTEAQKLEAVGDSMIQTLQSGGKIMWMGNGGSAADAQHLAAELIGKFQIDRPPLSSIALTTDTSVLTATGNDFSFSEIFSRQIQGIGTKRDFLVGITTSGNSSNIISGLKQAKKQGIKTMLLSSSKCPKMNFEIDFQVLVPETVTAHIQELHIAVGQSLCGYIESFFYDEKTNS